MGQEITISSSGNRFGCYLSSAGDKTSIPGIVLASSAFGVTEDLKWIADFLSSKGFLVAAPDVFWRGDKGPLPRGEDGLKRATARTHLPYALAEATDDVKTTLDFLRNDQRCNGHTAVLGFCFGGPIAIAGINRLGADCGASYHGSEFAACLDDLGETSKPIQLHWGDDDFALPTDLLNKIREIAARTPHCSLSIYPGVKHGYTGRTSPGYDASASNKSWESTLSMMSALATP